MTRGPVGSVCDGLSEMQSADRPPMFPNPA
nr:MAG TPA: hypothetical protein [Caudoviricetes sp.]